MRVPVVSGGVDAAAFDRLLDRYSAFRGRGARGLQTPETVERLGLDGDVDDTTPLDDEPLDPRPHAGATE